MTGKRDIVEILDDVKIVLEVSSIDKAIWVEKEMVKLLPAIVKTAQSCFREVLVYEERLIGLLDIICEMITFGVGISMGGGYGFEDGSD